MAVDTTSPLLQLLLQGTGNNNNTWGTNLNNSVFLLLEQAIAGLSAIPVTGAGDVTLTDDESRSATIAISGVLTANQTIIVPARVKKWTIYNGTTGSFQVLLKVSGSSVLRNAPRAVWCDMYSNGSDLHRIDAHKVGEFFYYAGSSVPVGALECTSAYVERADYPDLFAAIGTTWGNTTGTNFRLPPGTDTGRFLRSRTASVVVGTAQSNQNKSHTHTGSGTTGTVSADHTHSYSGSTGTVSAFHAHSYTLESYFNGCTGSVGSGLYAIGSWAGTNTGTETANHTHAYSGSTGGISSNHTHAYSFTTSTGSADGTEARPEAIVGMLCIRY